MASLIAPTKATMPSTMPVTPVTIFPLSRHITQSRRLTARTATDDHQAVVPTWPDRKLTPPTSAPVITRTVTRLIRSGRGARAGLGNVQIAGNHVHHQVFGILIIIGTGIVLVSATPSGAALSVAAAVFGVGVGLTVDEFALWLRLRDVYWTRQGLLSVQVSLGVTATLAATILGLRVLRRGEEKGVEEGVIPQLGTEELATTGALA